MRVCVLVVVLAVAMMSVAASPLEYVITREVDVSSLVGPSFHLGRTVVQGLDGYLYLYLKKGAPPSPGGSRAGQKRPQLILRFTKELEYDRTIMNSDSGGSLARMHALSDFAVSPQGVLAIGSGRGITFLDQHDGSVSTLETAQPVSNVVYVGDTLFVLTTTPRSARGAAGGATRGGTQSATERYCTLLKFHGGRRMGRMPLQGLPVPDWRYRTPILDGQMYTLRKKQTGSADRTTGSGDASFLCEECALYVVSLATGATRAVEISRPRAVAVDLAVDSCLRQVLILPSRELKTGTLLDAISLDDFSRKPVAVQGVLLSSAANLGCGVYAATGTKIQEGGQLDHRLHLFRIEKDSP